MQVFENFNLINHNTFGIQANAKWFATINTIDELLELSNSKLWIKDKLILGGGSNVLFLNNFNGLVLKVATKGIQQVSETEESINLKVQAGENWHQFVLHAIKQGYGGLENLSLIPGNVGTSPMQNIGAYGVELKDSFAELTAFHVEDKVFHTFKKEDCEFGYRTSIFKTKEKGNYIITDVTFKLCKNPKLNISYGAIKEYLEKQNISEPTIKNVSDTVIAIRKSKLPNYKEIGNSGSFFKNPVVSQNFFEDFLQKNPNAPYYQLNDGVKIPAGWLIEQCGFKGKKVGNTGTYKNQALILVNHGGATGEEVWKFAQLIQSTVFEQYGIHIEPEVNLI